MRIPARAARPARASILGCLALFCFAAFGLAAQSSPPAAAQSSPPAAAQPPSPRIHGVAPLEGPWRFHLGDDPNWADPAFDDSSWSTVQLSRPLAEQGIDSYSGYAWYRLRLQPQHLAPFRNPAAAAPTDDPLDLLLTPNSIGQLAVYLNAVQAGRTRGMTDSPSMLQSPPIAVPLSAPAPDGSILVAVRAWVGSAVPVQRGILSQVELGARDDVADRLAAAIDRTWDRQVIAGLVVSFLFLCVALLGFTLYLAQRKHSEYLWLALLCLSVALMGASETLFALALLPWSVFLILNLWTGRIFMAVTLEFVLRFTESPWRRRIRAVQLAVLLLPVLALVQLQQPYEYLSVASQIVFSALVVVLLYRAWRRGRPDAGVMLLPFLLAATADSIDTVLDYAASRHWLAARFASHRFHLGPIEFSTSTVSFSVFLASLLAVILYRFIHVSQDEQRTAAEIEAARSVQALLIPTKLPSNRNFMLESAYLPVNGVGGDFFQVLPLQDGSMLIVVGDVSGKGLQAAMNASTLVGALRNELSHDPATVLGNLNHVLLGAGSSIAAKAVASFATCLCARVYTDGKVVIANAGHLSPYRDGREMELASGLPLGVIADIRYEQAEFSLGVGDRLIFLSDGVVEAANPQGELFGFERTQQVSNESARYIAQTARHFGQTDDITVVSLYFAARSESRPD